MKKNNFVQFGMVGLLVGLVATVLWRSIQIGTWLSGWDNLQTELDIGLNLRRSLSAVWQEYQGLGLLAGMGHAADLIRMIFQVILAIFVPTNYLRLAMNLMCVIGGVWGFWRLGSYWLRDNKHKFISVWLGTLFYLFNLGTMQNFWVPFEPFSVAYALIPWLFWAVSKYLDKPNKQNLAWVAVMGLLISPTGYLQTAFLTIFIAISVFVFLYRGNKIGFVARIKPLFAILIVNAFWLLPVMWFSLTSSSVTVEAVINKMATPEVAYSNQAFSGFVDILLMKGYWVSWHDASGLESREPLMKVWADFLSMPVVQAGEWLWLLFFGFCLCLVFRSKSPFKFGLLGIIMVYVMMLRGSFWPFGWVMDMMQSIFPLFSQIFRSPFTKWVMVGILVQAAIVTVGFSELSNLLGKIKRSVRFNYLFELMIGVLVVVLCLPLLTNGLFYQRMKVSIPREYQLLFDHLRKEDADKRIVNLPLSNMYGWVINSWGYRGSGLLWYGIKQPMLDRAFDVWSPYNETFYNEMSTAFYYCAEDRIEACARNVTQVFDKYQVSLALLDESVILPGQDSRVMRYDLWKKVLEILDAEPDFKSGFLSVYTVGNNTTGISVPKQYRQIEAETTYGRFDPYFSSEVTYVDGSDASYPFAGISKENVTQVVEYGEEGLVKIKGSEANTGKLTFPEFVEGEVWRGRIRATLSGEELKIELLPFGQLIIGEQHLPLWLDQRLEVIQLPEVLESVVVRVGDKTKQILRDKPDEIWDIPMVVGQGLSLKVFEGEGEQIVISTPSAKLGQLPKDKLIQVSGINKICLGYEQKNYQCLNQNHSLVTPREGVYWLDMLEKVEELPKVTSYQLIAGYEFPKEMWQTVKREYELEIRDKKYEIRWEQAGSVIDIRDKKYEIGDKNCDVLKRGIAKKSVVDGEVVYETADYGAYCDSWWVSPITEEGLLRLTGENGGGRGLKLSVFSTQEKRTNLEQLLPSGGAFDQSYGFLTGLEQGSTINLETKSFGRIEGKNQLDAAKFYPVPLTWLQKIKIGEERVVDNQLKISEIHKWGTGIYQIKIQNPNDKFQNGLIVLNQGFDNGWIAFKPFDFAQGFQHVKVNGWSNGWMIENSNDKEQITNVLIFYWPQLMEWVGLGMLPLSLFWLLRKSEK